MRVRRFSANSTQERVGPCFGTISINDGLECDLGKGMINRALCVERAERSTQGPEPQAFEQQHYNIAHWAGLWGFSAKTVREWFRDEAGPGILRQPNTGRRKRRDYTTMMISPIAAARVYSKRTEGHLIN